MQRMKNEKLDLTNCQRGLVPQEMGGEIKKGIIRQGEDSKQDKQ